MNSKRVLIVTYYFPPRLHVASLRLRGLAKYLPEFGWAPLILTAALPGAPDQRFQVIQTPYPGDATSLLKKKLHLRPDKGFQEQVGIPLAIRQGKRSFTSKVMTFVKGVIAYPDEQKGWHPFAVKTGIELLQEGNFNALISSSGPMVTHLIAKDLKARHHIPWIADLRDLWTQDHYYPYGFLRKWCERRLELKTLSWADALVTVSEPLAEKLSTLYRKKPVFAIPNGFDPDEARSAPLTKAFTITHTGQLYRGKRDPGLLLKALHELITERVIDPNAPKVRFFGPTQYWLEQEIKRHRLEEIAKQYGIVPREVALMKQRESQVLLLLNWDDPREQGVYTGKIFEYLAARRPILAIGGVKGVVGELLEETGAGVHISNLLDLEEVLRSWYREYEIRGQVPYQGRDDQIAKYSHHEMARKFARVLNSVL